MPRTTAGFVPSDAGFYVRAMRAAEREFDALCRRNGWPTAAELRAQAPRPKPSGAARRKAAVTDGKPRNLTGADRALAAYQASLTVDQRDAHGRVRRERRAA